MLGKVPKDPLRSPPSAVTQQSVQYTKARVQRSRHVDTQHLTDDRDHLTREHSNLHARFHSQLLTRATQAIAPPVEVAQVAQIQ